MSMCYICKYKNDTSKMGRQICTLCEDSNHFEPRHDCGTCANNSGSWPCDNCKDYNLWAARNVYEGMPDDVSSEPKDVIVPFVIQLQLPDESCMALANAICNHCRGAMTDGQTALIYLEELVEHIDSHIRAERKWLEHYERSQKGE